MEAIGLAINAYAESLDPFTYGMLHSYILAGIGFSGFFTTYYFLAPWWDTKKPKRK